MKAHWLVVSVVGLLGHWAWGQHGVSPPIQWQRGFGGADNDFLSGVRQLSDGGYVVTGTSYSPRSGDRTAEKFGRCDYWLLRLDHQGTRLWDKGLGGTDRQFCGEAQQTRNGDLIVGGSSSSGVSGNKTIPLLSTNVGFVGDYWVLLLDRAGDTVWEHGYGGDYDDKFSGLMQTPDGGFLLAGWKVGFPSGNRTATNWGGEDYWAVRVDADGFKLWDRSFGGGGADLLWAVTGTHDGGFLLGGGSESAPGGNKSSPNFGQADFWVVRLDSEGDKVWDHSFGGTGDDTLYTLRQMPDGGFALGGRSLSPPSGNKTTPNFGNGDFWLVRLDAEGNKIAEQAFGGIGDDYLYSLDVTTDGGLILGGYSGSPPSGNKTSIHFGSLDYWVVRLDADMNKLWEASYGGSRSDVLQSLQQTADGGFILGGYSWSPADGNKTVRNVFFADYWLIKLGPEQPQLRLDRSAPAPAGLRLEMEGVKNLRYAIDYSTRLDGWTPLQTNRLGGSRLEVVDAGMTNASQRFYRARQVP